MPHYQNAIPRARCFSPPQRAVSRWVGCVAGLFAIGLTASAGAQPGPPLPGEGDSYGIVREAPLLFEEGFVKSLARARTGELIELPLFDGDVLVAATQQVETHAEGFDWIGKVAMPGAGKHRAGKRAKRKPAPRGTGVGDVMLSVTHDGDLVGTVWLDDTTYSIRRGDADYVLAEVDSVAFAPTHDDAATDDSDGRTLSLERLENRRVFTRMLRRQALYDGLHARLVRAFELGRVSDRVLTRLPEPGSRVDVMIFTTAEADDWLDRNGYVPSAALAHLVTKANTAFTESWIGTQLALVVTGLVSYTEDGDESLRTDRDNLRNGHGDLQILHDLRDLLKVDIVTLLVRYPPSETRNCGRAIRLKGPALPADLVPDASGKGPSESVGFNVMNVDCAVLGETYTHEVGHTFGAAHDNYRFQKEVAQGLAANPPVNVTPAIPGGHGFVLIEPNRRTVMAYPDVCVEIFGQNPTGNPCPVIARFSNALQTYDGSAPMGIPVGVFFGAADNAAVINLTAQTVANFRHAYVP